VRKRVLSGADVFLSTLPSLFFSPPQTNSNNIPLYCHCSLEKPEIMHNQEPCHIYIVRSKGEPINEVSLS